MAQDKKPARKKNNQGKKISKPKGTDKTKIPQFKPDSGIGIPIDSLLNQFYYARNLVSSIQYLPIRELKQLADLLKHYPDINYTLSSKDIEQVIAYDKDLQPRRDVEQKIDSLKEDNKKYFKELVEKQEAIEKKRIKIEELKSIIDNLKESEAKLSQQQRLRNLLYRVNSEAGKKLVDDEDFCSLFEGNRPYQTVVLAIDIRRSTELMLKTVSADKYQSFIVDLCMKLKEIITRHYGVFDKFTGDGILSFFPDFFSGEDAIYLAIQASDECHKCFTKHYLKSRNSFTVVLDDVGLGIGIDYGEAHLVNVEDWLTVIGEPVVYSCRLSAAKAGKTLLNQQAYSLASIKYSKYLDFSDEILPVKHEGNIVTYLTTIKNTAYKPKPPNWVSKK